MKISLKKIVVSGVLLFSCFSQSADAMQKVFSRTVGSRLSSSAHNLRLIPNTRFYSDRIVPDITEFKVPVIETEKFVKDTVVLEEPIVERRGSYILPESEWGPNLNRVRWDAAQAARTDFPPEPVDGGGVREVLSKEQVEAFFDKFYKNQNELKKRRAAGEFASDNPTE